jgi:hypothetical protein
MRRGDRQCAIARNQANAIVAPAQLLVEHRIHVEAKGG